MLTDIEETVTVKAAEMGFGAVASAFIMDSIRHMIPWLMVAVAVIACDLAAGIRKSLLMGEDVRFSRAVRLTMGKTVTYFSFIVMVCMINIAAGEEYDIEKWACLAVCAIEMCSIITNLLKPKGISINWGKVFLMVTEKIFGKSDYTNIVKKEENENSKE